jgi:hypothetical protein
LPTRIKFYQSTSAASLPEYQNGAIFIVQRDGTKQLGDMYVDVETGKRLHIKPETDAKIYSETEFEDLTNEVSSLGAIYITYVLDENNERVQTGIRVGDGLAYIKDLPKYPYISQEKIDFWDNKVNAYIATDSVFNGAYTAADANETLVLTRVL